MEIEAIKRIKRGDKEIKNTEKSHEIKLYEALQKIRKLLNIT